MPLHRINSNHVMTCEQSKDIILHFPNPQSIEGSSASRT